MRKIKQNNNFMKKNYRHFLVSEVKKKNLEMTLKNI